MKKGFKILLLLVIIIYITGCSKNFKDVSKDEPLLFAAASSLKNCFDNIIPMFEEEYPHIKVDVSYDSSGKLQSQIEQGAEIDVFMSASKKQMDALVDKELIVEDSVVPILENKIVLITSESGNANITGFGDVLNADIVAVGDPESVPAGQYAKEIFENLGIWNEVWQKASLGTNVTEVLNWVAAGNADVGVVYATDASSNDKVKVVTDATVGSVSPVIYPIGMVKSSDLSSEVETFIKYLQSEEIAKIFEDYGFTSYNQEKE